MTVACREGCKTKSHESYAECLRAAKPQVNSVINSDKQWMFEKTRKDLRAYEQAKADGINPRGTSELAVREAQKASDLLKRPYDAASDPPAQFIENKTAAKFVNWKED